ncbi:sensor histidine kinase [Chryseobacterium carnipullorum]|uniref:sensor histidine kinase n=1 Tax=Chryseobacterium carnipullorum TaxID=1124835 RepID=UPI000E8B0471|nr:HAMP domain-containing sensor histidine kinase [Chryseobacterium carnipullorum]MDN5477018.1 HAMP domain-containing histidine kinase [Chryseobacterium sp.]HBV14714.1 sensor histidine kinase [Chryseobacterium carnipullorum]
MMSKSKSLIALFAALFLLLLGIQGYFMYKTYQVKEREIYRTVHEKITHYTDQLEDLGGIKNRTDDTIQKILIEYHDKKISKKDFLEYFNKNKKENEARLNTYVDNSFKKEGYKIAAKIEYTSIVYLPDSSPLIDRPLVLYETSNKVVKPKISNTGTWETTSKFSPKDGGPSKNESFLVKSNTGFEILNIKTIIFKELALLTICCAAILLSVLLIYIFTVKNLARQQKQVEVLHTVVDNISHEFKTPIATLKIASKALKKEWNPETLPLIDRQITRLENLMSQIHKDETPETSQSIQPDDWNYFVQDIDFTYPETDFELINQVSEELPFDKNLMETIIKNLCENSVKYGASYVKMHITTISQCLKIEVSDNGCGIEKSELTDIFEKFYRIQSNNIHNTKGLGLGLYFVKNIVTKYHGTIDVSSHLQSGTTFKISIPYEN